MREIEQRLNDEFGQQKKLVEMKMAEDSSKRLDAMQLQHEQEKADL